MKLEIGGVYHFESLKEDKYTTSFDLRILCIDEYSTLSIPIFSGFGISNYKLKGTYYFSPTSNNFLEPRVKLLELKPFTLEEFNVYRPDLLLRLCRSKQLSWNDEIFSSKNNIENYIKEKEQKMYENDNLQIDKIYIEPYGKAGGTKSGVLIEADNGKYFTASELLFKANLIQSKVNPLRSNGVGIFRCGTRKSLPVFYIGEYYDLAEIMKEFD